MEEEPWIVKIDNEVDKMEDSSAESARWKKQSIYRVPACVTDLNPKAFTPQMVSFGPYHHGEENLKAMEEHKQRALLHFLKRFKKPLKCYVKALTPIVQYLKDAYDQLDHKWEHDTDAFLKLMIVDGCFMLEILWSATSIETQTHPHAQAQGQAKAQAQAQPQTQTQTQPQTQAPAPAPKHQSLNNDYANNDPIFSNHGKLYFVPYLKRDMLMLENQLPILVLQKLFHVASVPVKGDQSCEDVEIECEFSLKEPVVKLILKFFSQTKKIQPFHNCLHILDVYRKSLLLENPQQKNQKYYNCFPRDSTPQSGDDIIRSATELNEAGIKLKKSKSRSLKDISFHNGVLELPLVVVDDTLESSYLNMIAFERFHVGAGNEVTSYIFFMDNIIDSPLDVSLLHSCGIIQNALGSDKAVANLFNSLSMDITLDPNSSLEKVHNQVSAYCQKRWHKWRANLMHNYFTNPWAILSVIAAIFLFALTIIQTVYGTLDFYSK